MSAVEGASQRPGGLVIELTRPPKFYMDSSGSGGFYECGDFTEDQQASQIMVHHLGGHSKVLSGQLAKLVSLEAYQNRHNNFFDPMTFAVSAPVSPVGHRPQSQPNHLVHPSNPAGLFPPENAPGMMGPPGPRGHKRQRSRSVPVAMDFSMLRHPMPSFLIQQEGQMTPAHQQDPSIFAPVPQHQHQNNFSSGPAGPNLSIDTSAGYPAFQFGGPTSATAATSPSDYSTPGFFTSAPPGESLQQTQFSTPYNGGFLNVDPSSMIGTSNTPLSIMSSHGDPVIADHSPPLNGVGRSQSADIFGTPGEHSQFGDEGLFLSESFNKQIALPFRSPLTEESFHSPMPDTTFNFNSPQTNGSDNSAHHLQMHFQSPPPQPQDGSVHFQSPPSQPQAQQLHQDSGVAFATPPQSGMHNSPKDGGGMVYQDSKIYSSPAPLQNQQQQQQQQPAAAEDVDFSQYGMYVNPSSLGQR